MFYYKLTNIDEGNFECPYTSTFETQPGHVAKMQLWPSGWKSKVLNLKVLICFWIFFSLNRCPHFINTELVAILSATASAAQLAEHCTRFVRSRVRFPAGRPNLYFRNRSRLGLKSRGMWALDISFINICQLIIKYSKEGANIHIYIYIYTVEPRYYGHQRAIKIWPY